MGTHLSVRKLECVVKIKCGMAVPHSAVSSRIEKGKKSKFHKFLSLLVPVCTPPPSSITNREVNVPPGGTPLHTVVEYSCRVGTRMIGNHTLECLEDGKWSSDPPICEGT